jgi:surface antigen
VRNYQIKGIKMKKSNTRVKLGLVGTVALLVCSAVLAHQFKPELGEPTKGGSRFYKNYCTWFAAREFDKAAPSPWVNWQGNAGAWLGNADRKGWKTTTDPQSAKVNAIVVWGNSTYGHVAIIRSVDGDNVNIDEMNFGKMSDKADEKANGVTVNFGKITSAKLNKKSMNRGSSLKFSGYILPERK